MAKNRNKKKNGSGTTAMDVSGSADPSSVVDTSQAMDTSESGASRVSVGGALRKIKGGRQMKRSKNVRKMKAIAKAISQNEKSEIKVTKGESKIMRTKFAKNLYD